MRRHWIILSAAILAATVREQRASDRNGAPGSDAAPNVILVVSDGLRWQDVFTGADSAILFGAPAMLGSDPGSVRRKYWRATASERRAALLPFLWSTVAREGQLAGNRNVGSDVDVTNGRKFSYPGYNEMLVGAPGPRIDRNGFGPNPNVTVFEWLHRRSEGRPVSA